MKKRKQFLAVLMTGVMVAALSACGLTGQVQAAEQNAQEETGTSYDTTADGIVQTTSGQLRRNVAAGVDFGRWRRERPDGYGQ